MTKQILLILLSAICYFSFSLGIVSKGGSSEKQASAENSETSLNTEDKITFTEIMKKNPKELYQLAEAYEQKNDFDNAYKLYLYASLRGSYWSSPYLPAQFKLARIFEEGQMGAQKNIPRAADIYWKIIENKKISFNLRENVEQILKKILPKVSQDNTLLSRVREQAQKRLKKLNSESYQLCSRIFGD